MLTQVISLVGFLFLTGLIRRDKNNMLGSAKCFAVFGILIGFSLQTALSVRTWVCDNNKCVKNETSDATQQVSIQECKLTCLPYAGLWPKPTGNLELGQTAVPIDVHSISFDKSNLPSDAEALVTEATNIFLEKLQSNEEQRAGDDSLYNLNVHLEIQDPSVLYLTSDTDESYKLEVNSPDEQTKEVKASITANTFFGLRHGLETLSQLVIYDDLHKVSKLINNAVVEDNPVFKFRGVALDTARSYITVEKILKTLDVMSSNKLNSFHWHITDTHSFPYVSKKYPELSQRGAYSESKIYTTEDIQKIVEYGRVRGIRVIPEFDAPAHVGEGWDALGSDLITCFKWEPWTSYCVEPPCGQFDPTNDKVYEILGDIFQEYVDLFHSDLFHMGGDEVNIGCWQSTPRIVEWMQKNNYTISTDGFVKLWGYYQDKALQKLRSTNANPPQVILWTSTLTESSHIDRYLKPEDYIIQIWTKGDDSAIKELVDRKFRVIFSTYNELYLDCGGPSWVGGPGQNWCSPYINWQHVYSHSPHKILENLGVTVTDEVKKLVLGSESQLWTEQVDSGNIDSRLWPRASALAERLWSNPDVPSEWSQVRYRLNNHRYRLVRLNLAAELLQPEWCYQNDGFCE